MLSRQSISIEAPRRNRITAISSAVQRRPIILVLGMHRSGTSLCSHLLSALGVDMSDKIPGPGNPAPTPDNPRGHWERWEIVEFHDRILGLFNRDYFGLFHDFALPVAWWANPRVAEIRRKIATFLELRMGGQYFGFKDPRTVRLMPVWHQIFNELRLAPKVVLCLRNPAQVARSLQARDVLDPVNGEYRWLVHMIDFYRYTSNFDCCTLEYEEWFNNPSGNFEKLKQFLGLQWQQSESDLGLVLSGIIDPAARHDDFDHREPGQPLVRTMYELARRVGQDGVRDQINSIVAQFLGFQQLQLPFIAAFEEMAKTAAKHSEIEQEAGSLRVVVSQREAALVNLSHRVDELVAALDAARAEIAARETALRRGEREAREAASLGLALQSEITALWETLVTGRIELEHAIAAEAMQAEIAELRDALAEAKREHAIATDAMRTETAVLRLTQAERETQARATDAAALHDEIAALHRTLAAARKVGKAAIAALGIEAGRRRSRLRGGDGRPSCVSSASKELLTRANEILTNPIDGEMAVGRAVDQPDGGMTPRKSDPLLLADRARAARQWELAARLYREALDRDPQNQPIWVQYGHALKEWGELRDPDKLARAEFAYRKALSLHWGVADSYLQLGHVLKLEGRKDEAVAAYLRAFALDPSLAHAMDELRGLEWSEVELSELRLQAGSDRDPATENGRDDRPGAARAAEE